MLTISPADGAGVVQGARGISLSPRVELLRQYILDDENYIDHFAPRGWLIADSMRETEGQPWVVRQATALGHVIRNYPILVRPGELVVGYQQHESFRGIGWLEFEPLSNPEHATHMRERADSLDISDEWKSKLHGAIDYWSEHPRHTEPQFLNVPDYIRDDEKAGMYFGGGGSEGHTVPSYETVIREGFEGIRQRVDDALAVLIPWNPEDEKKRVWLTAVREIADAACELGARHAEYLRDLAVVESDITQANEYRMLADICDQVPAKPARTFHEAVQTLWFAHMVMGWEDGVNANSYGRYDQYLYPCYKADLEAGRITPDDALELLEAFHLALYKSYDVQQATIGGQLPDGSDATNDLTYLFIEAVWRVNLIRCMSVRVHKGTPRPLLESAFRVIRRGGGVPFFFNDEAIIPALVDKGIPVEDARNYAIIGCVEVTIPGRTNPHAVSHMMNNARCLELALNDGCDIRTGDQIGPSTGTLTDMTDIEELWAAYTTQMEYFARHAVEVSNRGDMEQPVRCQLPYTSLLTEDCIANGTDMTAGGARFNYHSTCAIGLPNVGDSIHAVEKLVFEDKSMSASTLLELLRTDWDGAEAERQFMINRIPKYGNGISEVDKWVARAAQHYCDHMATYTTPHGGSFHAHLFSFVWHLDHGRTTSATPDGRKAGEPLAYSISATQGRDSEGLTPLLRSLMALPHDHAAGSSSAIIELTPKLLEGDGLERVLDAVQTSIDSGVGQLQFNVIDAETLLEAQADPDRFQHIAVRVSGFSMRFCLLDKTMQDHIIARTKHEEL
jgi:pyruvate formate-lyase/glycerol dehydratase family glycyl radical enzyme